MDGCLICVCLSQRRSGPCTLCPCHGKNNDHIMTKPFASKPHSDDTQNVSGYQCVVLAALWAAPRPNGRVPKNRPGRRETLHRLLQKANKRQDIIVSCFGLHRRWIFDHPVLIFSILGPPRNSMDEFRAPRKCPGCYQKQETIVSCFWLQPCYRFWPSEDHTWHLKDLT